jgi:hypothetical protein
MLYGAGIGIESNTQGTLPLALFSEHGYTATMGPMPYPDHIRLITRIMRFLNKI